MWCESGSIYLQTVFANKAPSASLKCLNILRLFKLRLVKVKCPSEGACSPFLTPTPLRRASLHQLHYCPSCFFFSYSFDCIASERGEQKAQTVLFIGLAENACRVSRFGTESRLLFFFLKPPFHLLLGKLWTGRPRWWDRLFTEPSCRPSGPRLF